MKYQGQVIDRQGNNILCNTRNKDTYEEAYHAAEVLAKRKGIYTSVRYSIKIVDIFLAY